MKVREGGRYKLRNEGNELECEVLEYYGKDNYGNEDLWLVYIYYDEKSIWEEGKLIIFEGSLFRSESEGLELGLIYSDGKEERELREVYEEEMNGVKVLKGVELEGGLELSGGEFLRDWKLLGSGNGYTQGYKDGCSGLRWL